ncbi:MAG: hypothetical protein IKF90_10275 [Parasporobacterium sp.]|nr:hypothetical protein [Parasporobacterium sp.]
MIAKLPLEDQEELAKRIITEDSVSTKQIGDQHKEDSANGTVQKTQDELLKELGINRVGAVGGAGCLGEPVFSLISHQKSVFHRHIMMQKSFTYTKPDTRKSLINKGVV